MEVIAPSLIYRDITDRVMSVAGFEKCSVYLKASMLLSSQRQLLAGFYVCHHARRSLLRHLADL